VKVQGQAVLGIRRRTRPVTKPLLGVERCPRLGDQPVREAPSGSIYERLFHSTTIEKKKHMIAAQNRSGRWFSGPAPECWPSAWRRLIGQLAGHRRLTNRGRP